MSGSNQETPGPRDDRPRLCLFRPRGHTLRPTAGCDSSATPRPTVPGPRRAPAEKSGSRNLRGPTTAKDELCRAPLASREHPRLPSRATRATRGWRPVPPRPGQAADKGLPSSTGSWSQLRRTSPRAPSGKEWAATQQVPSSTYHQVDSEIFTSSTKIKI